MLFFLAALPLYADVCIVPEGMCASETSPCQKDYLFYPTSRVGGDYEDDGDGASQVKVSLQHQQNDVGAPQSYVAEVCYESENDGKVGAYSLIITPTDVLPPAATTDCMWECTTGSCDGWHQICTVGTVDDPETPEPSCFAMGVNCTTTAGDTIEADFITMGDAYPAGYPTGNVILAQITFPGINLPSAGDALEEECTSNLCGVTAANIATLTDTKLEVTDIYMNNIFTNTFPTDIQVIDQQCYSHPPTGGNISCVPTSGSTSEHCPNSPALTDMTLTWSAPADPPCTGATDCGTVTYNIYEGDVKGTGIDAGAGLTTTSTGPTTVLGIDNTLTYYVYAKTANCSESDANPDTKYIQLTTANCACRTATITPTSVKVDGGDFSTAEPQVNTSLSVTGTLTDSDNKPEELTVKIFFGCSNTGCTNGGHTYAAPKEETVCSPTTTACGSTFTYTLSGDYTNFADADSAEALRAAFQVLQGTSVLSAEPAGFTGDLTNFSDYEIDKDAWLFSLILIFKKDHEPYPNELPFIATGNKSLCLGFEMIEEASVNVRVYHPDGTLIRVLDNDSSASASISSCDDVADNKCHWKGGCKWDGTSYLGSGNLVANGLYIIHLYAVGTGTSYSGDIIERHHGIVVMK